MVAALAVPWLAGGSLAGAQGSATDCDGNGVPDAVQFCAGGGDQDSDGYLDACEFAVGNFDLDGDVDGADLGVILVSWGMANPPQGDLDGARRAYTTPRFIKAGKGTRTLDIQLGKLTLYQLSYARRESECNGARRAPSVPQHTMYWHRRERGPAAQRRKFDKDTRCNGECSRHPHELDTCSHCATRGEQIVDHKYPRSCNKRILMDVQRVAAILQFVLNTESCCRQFARLAHWNEAGIQRLRDRSTENESTTLGTNHRIDSRTAPWICHQLNGHRQSPGIRQQRRDILEHDSLAREIRHISYKLLEH